MLGPNILAGQHLLLPMPGGCWFGAEPCPGTDFSLVSWQRLAPGFDFRDFELAKAACLVRRYPFAKEGMGRSCRLPRRLCRSRRQVPGMSRFPIPAADAAAPSQSEIIIRRSRFLTHCAHTPGMEAARAFVEQNPHQTRRRHPQLLGFRGRGSGTQRPGGLLG